MSTHSTEKKERGASDSIGRATDSTSNGSGTWTDETDFETDTASEGEVWDSYAICFAVKNWNKLENYNTKNRKSNVKNREKKNRIKERKTNKEKRALL